MAKMQEEHNLTVDRLVHQISNLKDSGNHKPVPSKKRQRQESNENEDDAYILPILK